MEPLDLYHIVLTPEQLQVLALALDEMPFKRAAPLVLAIQQQCTTQENARQNQLEKESKERADKLEQEAKGKAEKLAAKVAKTVKKTNGAIPATGDAANPPEERVT